LADCIKKYNGEDNCHQINNLQLNIILYPITLEFNLLLTDTFPCLTPIELHAQHHCNTALHMYIKNKFCLLNILVSCLVWN